MHEQVPLASQCRLCRSKELAYFPLNFRVENHLQFLPIALEITPLVVRDVGIDVR